MFISEFSDEEQMIVRDALNAALDEDILLILSSFIMGEELVNVGE